MEQKRLPRVAGREERRLIELAAKATRADFPNPERYGCPGRDVLEAIARRLPQRPETEDVVDHIATCAACLDEYTGIRRHYRRHRISRIALASAAALVLAVAVAWRIGPILVPHRGRLTTRPSDPTLAATLDFRHWTAERSAMPHSVEGLELPHLRRGLFVLTIRLPIGTEDGTYALEVRNELNQTVINGVGTAKWDGSTEILTTLVDLRRLVPGDYLLAIGRTGSSWRGYPLRLE